MMISEIYFPEQVYIHKKKPFSKFINDFSEKDKTDQEKIEEVYNKLKEVDEEFNNLFFIHEYVTDKGKTTKTEFFEKIGTVLKNYLKDPDNYTLPKNITYKRLENTSNLMEAIDNTIRNVTWNRIESGVIRSLNKDEIQECITLLKEKYSDMIDNHYVYEPNNKAYNNKPYEEMIEEYIEQKSNQNAINTTKEIARLLINNRTNEDTNKEQPEPKQLK